MDAEQLIGSVIRGALTGRGKRSRRTTRYLVGGRNSFLTASTLMTAAGLAWGLIEQATGRDALAADQLARPGTAGSAVPPQGAASTQPPPLPPVPGAAAPTRMPSHPGVPDEVARLIRLAVSAARADGALAPAEEAKILEHARQVGAETIVERELASPTPLDALLVGVAEPKARQEIYTLAFAIVRADETVSGAERIYLAQLAHKLNLEPAVAARLEADVVAAIDEAADSTPSPSGQ